MAELETQIASATATRNYKEAFVAAQRFGEITRTRFGEHSRCYASALSQTGTLLHLLNRPAEAGPLLEQALALFREHAAANDPGLTLALNNLGVHRYWLRQYQDAARLHEEALELRRKRQPLDESAVAESLHNLADTYRYLGRAPQDVAKLYQQALDIKTRVLQPNNVLIAQTQQNLASAQELLGDLKSAAHNLEQALGIYRQRLAPDDPRIAAVINRQAIIHFIQGSNNEAERKFREALRLERASVMTQKSTLAATLDDFALNQMWMGRLEEAKTLAREALEIRRAVFLDNHPTIARTLSNLSELASLERDYGEALRLAREASNITIANGGSDAASKLRLQRHLRIAWSTGTQRGQALSLALADEAFIIGQQASRSDTAATVTRTALRFSARDPYLRELLKEVDDIDRELATLDQTLIHALTLRSDQSAEAFTSMRTQMAAETDRRKRLSSEIEKSFPDFARLISPKPLSTIAVQTLLGADEALVAFVIGFEEIYVWCITPDDVAWRKLDLRPQELEAIIGTLRASLDVEPEDTDPRAVTRPLFDLGLAHELYAKLLGPIASAIDSRSKLLVVPSGPLTSLPLHLLVTSRPSVPKPTRQQANTFREAEWLTNRYAVSVLPSVDSLEGLRRRAKPTPDRKPLIGFANPFPSPHFTPAGAGQTVASVRNRGIRAPVIKPRGLPASIWTRQTADTDALRDFLAGHILENSELELIAVGRALNADAEDLLTGPNATETAVKQANLASYRVVYFATHGFVGEFNKEPSLALTMPEEPNEFDDGLLTATEIAQFNLDADWVVLSACNTAAGATKGAEGLSGLARAFFHAGARTLLVSHWTLDDKSAMELMTAMFGALRENHELARSQAFRHAMLSQIRNADGQDRRWDAYPGRWAAFEMVGVD